MGYFEVSAPKNIMMHPFFHSLLPAILLAVLAGCAAPRYQTIYRYEGPNDAEGRICVERCQQQLDACQGKCPTTF